MVWKHANNERKHKPVDLKRCGNQSCVAPSGREFNSTSTVEVQCLSHSLPKPHLSSHETPFWIMRVRGNSHGWDFCRSVAGSGHCYWYIFFLWTVFLCLNYNFYTVVSACYCFCCASVVWCFLNAFIKRSLCSYNQFLPLLRNTLHLIDVWRFVFNCCAIIRQKAPSKHNQNNWECTTKS